MPAGGTGKPDGSSPFKTADGRTLYRLKSSRSNTLLTNSAFGTNNAFSVPPSKFDALQILSYRTASIRGG